jgi:hypothetical protein
MTSQYLCLLVFGLALYIIATDANVAQAFVYITRHFKNKFDGKFWWLMNNPRNPIVKYLMWRRSVKMAKEIRQKIDTYYEQHPNE